MSGGYLKIVLGVKCPVQLLQLYSLSCLSLFGAIPSGHVPASSFFLDWRCKLRLPKCLTICEHVMFALHNGLGDGQKMRFFRFRDVCPSGVASPADQLPSLGMSGLRLHDLPRWGLGTTEAEACGESCGPLLRLQDFPCCSTSLAGGKLRPHVLGEVCCFLANKKKSSPTRSPYHPTQTIKLWTKKYLWVRYGEMRSHETKIR